MRVTSPSYNKSTEYTELFTAFRGIAPEGDNSVNGRPAYLENLYRNYGGESVGALESVPGYRRLADFDDGINGLYVLAGELIVHSGDKLYHAKLSDEQRTCTPEIIMSGIREGAHVFAFGSSLFVIHGGIISEIKYDGLSFNAVTSPEPYLPTLFINGTPYESRNLLTNAAREIYDILDARDNCAQTRGIRYSIIDGNARICAVCGIDEGFAGELDIPGHLILDGVRYKVGEIADKAFMQNNEITALRIGEGVERIGRMAFYGCTSLKTVYTPSSLLRIDGAAFNSCTALSDVYLRSGLIYIGDAVFTAAMSGGKIHFEGTKAELDAVDGGSTISHIPTAFDDVDESMRAEIPVYSSPESISSVTVDGEAVSFEAAEGNEGITAVRFVIPKHWIYNGKRVRIDLSLPKLIKSFDGGDSTDATGIIAGCSITELFDGRVFFAGNPKLPSTVFYSSRTEDGLSTPLYVGEYNYFTDGTRGAPISRLLSVSGELAVFKSRDDGMGSIFHHTGADTGDNLLPRVYPVSNIHTGAPAIGPCAAFLDEAVFLTENGLAAIGKKQISLERAVELRSGSVTSHLLREELSEAVISTFAGYLAICCGESIYLADPRATYRGGAGNKEYEWYVIRGVGAHTGLRPVYRYASAPTAPRLGSVKHGFTDEPVVDRTVYSRMIGNTLVHYTAEGDKTYAVYRTDEQMADSLTPPSFYVNNGRTLLFATREGSLLAFNLDLVGVMPPHLGDKGISTEEYRESFATRIHPYYFSFEGVAPTYLLRTVASACDAPHLSKSTVKGSLTVKYTALASGRICCDVVTDSGGYSEAAVLGGGPIDFSDIDFSSLALTAEGSTTLPLKEKEKGWVEKSVSIYSKSFACPIAIHSIAFRYRIKGRIKHR